MKRGTQFDIMMYAISGLIGFSMSYYNIVWQWILIFFIIYLFILTYIFSNREYILLYPELKKFKRRGYIRKYNSKKYSYYWSDGINNIEEKELIRIIGVY